jgi:hypothetical protein
MEGLVTILGLTLNHQGAKQGHLNKNRLGFLGPDYLYILIHLLENQGSAQRGF